MAGKGIKVKELARELGVTSREIIDLARARGLAVQNRITRLDRHAEAIIRQALAEQGPSPLSTD